MAKNRETLFTFKQMKCKIPYSFSLLSQDNLLLSTFKFFIENRVGSNYRKIFRKLVFPKVARYTILTKNSPRNFRIIDMVSYF